MIYRDFATVQSPYFLCLGRGDKLLSSQKNITFVAFNKT